MKLYAAPLQGITTCVYRRTHAALFGGIDRYYTPFISPAAEHILTEREKKDLLPERNTGISVVPQVMTKRAEDLLWAAEALAEMGYREVNLNLGCPSGTVTAKGKGAGFLADPEGLARFFDAAFAGTPPVPISVKTRLGMRDPGEFERILTVYQQYPIAELTVHPRVQKDFYKLPVRMDAFAAILPEIRLPLCYNGDLVTVEDVTGLRTRFPQVETLMLGRGLIADPALPRKLRGGVAASREELERFTETLYAAYCALYGAEGPAAQRMKELWYYLIHLFDGGEKYAKKMRRVSHPAEYQRLERGIFQELSLRSSAEGPL